MSWIIERLSEKTTWIGFISLLGALGVVFSPEQKEAIVGAAVGLVGAILVVTRERNR
jgi:hypothetical protein